MRFGAASLLLSTSAFLGAQSFPGAKPDPVTSTAAANSGGGIGPLFNVLLALGLVYGLMKWAAPKVIAKMNKRIVTGAGSAIHIEESAQFAGGSLYVVSARGKSLLLSVSNQGVSCLADLTEPTEKLPEPPTFGDLVETEMRAVIAPMTTHEADSDDEVSEALRRLERLAG